jgi:hypothetical protein
MTATPRIDRQTKAAQIASRGDIHESRPGIFRVRDVVTGSGHWHITTATSCSCTDFSRTGLACKHQLAVAAYQSKPAAPTCPTCGAATKVESFYIGGRGYCAFRCCTRNPEHKAERLS